MGRLNSSQGNISIFRKASFFGRVGGVDFQMNASEEISSIMTYVPFTSFINYLHSAIFVPSLPLTFKNNCSYHIISLINFLYASLTDKELVFI